MCNPTNPDSTIWDTGPIIRCVSVSPSEDPICAYDTESRSLLYHTRYAPDGGKRDEIMQCTSPAESTKYTCNSIRVPSYITSIDNACIYVRNIGIYRLTHTSAESGTAVNSYYSISHLDSFRSYHSLFKTYKQRSIRGSSSMIAVPFNHIYLPLIPIRPIPIIASFSSTGPEQVPRNETTRPPISPISAYVNRAFYPVNPLLISPR